MVVKEAAVHELDLTEVETYVRDAIGSRTRKDGATPEWMHPFRVRWIIETLFGIHDKRTLAVGLMHDLIEDTAEHHGKIADRFGLTIANHVDDQTYREMSKTAYPIEQARKIAKYEEKLSRVARWKMRACLVSFADILDNLFRNDGSRDPQARDPYRWFMLNCMLPELEGRMRELADLREQPWRGPLPSDLITRDGQYLGPRPILSEELITTQIASFVLVGSIDKRAKGA